MCNLVKHSKLVAYADYAVLSLHGNAVDLVAQMQHDIKLLLNWMNFNK